jgi:two-component system, OmpR family, sensor kinase
MKSLLNKNLIQFVSLMLVILVLAIPLFYLLTKNYYAEDMMDVITRISKGEELEPSDLEADIVDGMVIQFVLIFAVMSLSMLLVMQFLTRRLWKPFDNTLQKIERFNLDSSDIPQFQNSGTLEFERLNRSVEKLMRKDKETYKSQKEFTENASHELQTPITVIQTKLDLLMQEELNQRQANLVSDMYNICNRLSRLNKNLLLLAKIENSQYSQTETIELESFINRRITIYSDLNVGGGKVVFDNASTMASISANIPLFESMLDNLVINAMRHKKDNADIIISVSSNCLSITNEGEDNIMLDKNNLFKRFNNIGEKNRGNGLGLSIVKAICDYHHWAIDYQFIDGRHKFIIKFK